LEKDIEIELPDFGQKNIVSINISNNEELVSLSVNSSSLPTDIYIYNLENNSYKKLTNTLNQLIDPNHLVEGESVRFKSFDGVEVPALLYKPKFANKNNKVSAMLWIHGGPGGQTRLDYTLWNTPLFQYLVKNGYAVLAVNNRGSSGYGKTFFTLDDKRHGEDDLKDCILAKDYLATLDYIDVENIGIIGASYGGYMVMAALAFAPEEFNVGVNIFGVTNWIRTLRSIPPFWADFKASLYNEVGNPYSNDSLRLKEISPLFHADNIVNPLMVLQGSNDPRVLQIESDEIVNAVRENGVPVEYVLFSDEGHGFRKMENEIEAYKKIIQFLDEYMKVATY
ncbi:MAG: S9 family peptidase, partial [Bacteroidales bacterium]|nr:S9 family peptidase [Bacteroidales bacterium]